MDNDPRPRLCHVTKWSTFDGYGFNLHAEKSKPGQFIGKVDPGSPAAAAGLKEGDRIVEVNGVNINHENHKQVVQRIKAVPNETRLLVLDANTDRFFREHDMVVTGSMERIQYMTSDIACNTVNDNHNKLSVKYEDDDHHINSRQLDEDERSMGSAASSTEKKAFASSSTDGSSPRSTPSPEPADSARVHHHGGSSLESQWDGLSLNCTAKEMRSRIGSKKKRDPRKDDRMDFRKKYEIIDSL